MSVESSLFLLGALSLFALVQGLTLEELKLEALSSNNAALTCGANELNCECAFKKEKGCCCGVEDLYQTENDVYSRLKVLYMKIQQLETQVQSLTTEGKIAFQARLESGVAAGSCYGPFNTDVPIPLTDVLLNDGNIYNKHLGTATAPRKGVYLVSFTIKSMVGETILLYHKVDLMVQGERTVSVMENNRQDGLDSATQMVTLLLNKGDQVYLRLVSGRKICSTFGGNLFSMSLLFTVDDGAGTTPQ
ncbi:unnamed protein product [Knipowitschia caucasica]